MTSTISNCLLLALLTLAFACNAIAHEAGVTDTSIVVTNNSVRLMYTVPLEHLSEITGGNTNADSGGVAVKAVQAGFGITNNDVACKMTSAATRNLSEVKSRQFAYLYFCDDPMQLLHISYNLLFKDDLAHKNFARLTFLGKSENITFSDANRFVDIDLESKTLKEENGAQAFLPFLNTLTVGSNYFPVGVEHILLGPDHLLFLAALLLLPLRFRHILALITTFTISHSITLALSVMDIIVLKPSFVEWAIALSIVYMAIETIYMLRRHASGNEGRYLSGAIVYKRVLVTACFGLIHGFGFSYFLKEIGLGDQIFSSLLFFNFGVESGQLLAMIVFLPIVAYLFKRFTSMVWAQALALAIGAFGLIWLVERSPALMMG